MPFESNDEFIDIVINDVAGGLAAFSSFDSAQDVLAAESPEQGAELRVPPEVFVPDACREDPAVNGARTFAAVPWVAHGVHTGELAGFGPTRREVVIQGITIVQSVARPEAPDQDDFLRFHRQVDWLGVYQQLGIVASKRRPSDAPANDPTEPIPPVEPDPSLS